MAEIKTGIFAKNVQKRLNRAQEKVLQKLGKADETKDEQFEQCVQNFKRQESEGSRLQREMKAYLAAVKGMQQASMNLTESLHEVYEPDWYGKDDVMTVGKSCDALWEDFHQKLVDSSLITLDTYLSQFPDIKTRVSKRSRKLIDYDSARHHLETLQASTIRNDRKLSKAEEELKKAQKVFDDFNVDLQQELPTLWDSRVGFYVSTFKNVTHLEAKFHREISVLCHKLYEVMNKLAEQHSDKMFTIQGAPSDSGPLRFARTPTPPDESPPESPEDSPNHTLAPGPHRPKSPSLLKKGPPVPPPPKITPTTELHQEQIISLFDNNFAPDAASAPATAAQAIDSLLDMDFDPFKPDSAAPIGQSQSPMSQTLPWDLWTAPAAEAVQPGASDWAADFSGLGAGQEAAAAAADAGEAGAAGAAEAPDWPPAEGWGTEAAAAPLAESAEAVTIEIAETKMTEAETAETETKMADTETAEIETAAEDASVEVETAKAEVSNNALNGVTQSEPEAAAPEAETEAAPEPVSETGEAQEPPAAAEASETSPTAEKPADTTEAEVAEPVVSPEAESPEITPPTDAEKQPCDEAALETATTEEVEVGSPTAEAPAPAEDKESPKEQTLTVEPEGGEEGKQEGAEETEAKEEKMPIPSVVIEPASSNEGDDDRDGDITSPTVSTGNGVTPESQPGPPGMPPGFLYKVEALHDFEAANSDELELKKGDVVLVLPTENMEDQDAGWLTGIKESDWLQQGGTAPKGLFPENFVQRSE
ncbi:amphiphysin-like isoform X2 [Anguilla anguilla]|uniref:amphiphysin-like isoform X2 n=1 Tax=Anguilla anguilla TaxID=7936 RepID=UPI0015B0B376|nr:amphiphysin-like isoform X2 [Anguilla anguilla]